MTEQLPTSNEPLVLADGRKIDPANGSVMFDAPVSFVSVPNALEAQEIVSKTRRRMVDMPCPPKQMNAVTLVVTYTLWGLADEDIATAMDMTVSQVERIRTLEAYTQVYEDLVKGIVESDKENVRDMFQKHSRTAAARLVEGLNDQSYAVQFAASKEVLDRAGHRPADVVQHQHMMMDELRIVHIKRDESKKAPEIDGNMLEPE